MAFGMNNEQMRFRDKVKTERDKMDQPTDKTMPAASKGKTEIEHKDDGSHSVTHSDGEKTEHPTMGHAVMAIHAKHEPGPAHLMHAKDAGVTTHQVGHDGEVQGPTEHPDADSAAEEAKAHMGDGSMSGDDMMMPEPEGSYA